MRSFGTWINRLLIPLLFGLMLLIGIGKERLGGAGALIWSDAEGYYLYLPATFVYGSWQVWDGQDGLEMLSCCKVNDSGIVRTRYTYGVAAMQMPFFLGAHAYASIFQGKDTPPPANWSVPQADPNAQNIQHRKYNPLRGQATGFSDTYGMGLVIAAAFYAALGLWFVRKILRRHFSEPVSAITTVLVFLGTNLYYYTVNESGMSHVYSFCLMAAFMWLVHRWMERRTWALSLALGSCISLLFLIRPTNLIVALLLVMWEVYSIKDLGLRFKQLWTAWPHMLAVGGIAFLIVVPQLLYWRYAFGENVVWSYEGEGFTNATHPQILKVLFSYQNGLFLYTPIASLAIVGIFMGWRMKKYSSPGLLLIFLLATYIFASWWAWWFGGAFGHRCYVEFYALLALPLAAVVKWIWENPRALVKWAGIAMLLGFVYANIKMTALYTPPWDGDAWTMGSYVAVVKNVARIWWWPGF